MAERRESNIPSIVDIIYKCMKAVTTNMARIFRHRIYVCQWDGSIGRLHSARANKIGLSAHAENFRCNGVSIVANVSCCCSARAAIYAFPSNRWWHRVIRVEKRRAYAFIEAIATSCIVHARQVCATQHEHRIYRLPLILFRSATSLPAKNSIRFRMLSSFGVNLYAKHALRELSWCWAKMNE